MEEREKMDVVTSKNLPKTIVIPLLFVFLARQCQMMSSFACNIYSMLATPLPPKKYIQFCSLIRGAKKKPYLTVEQFVQFLNKEQRDPRLNEILYPYYTVRQAQDFIDEYEPRQNMAAKGDSSYTVMISALFTKEKNNQNELDFLNPQIRKI